MFPSPERPISVLPYGIDTSAAFLLGSVAWTETSGSPVKILLFGLSISMSGRVVLNPKSVVSSWP